MTSLGVAYLIETLSKIKSLEEISIHPGKPRFPPLTVLGYTKIDAYALLPVLKLGDLPRLKNLVIGDCKPLVFLSLFILFVDRMPQKTGNFIRETVKARMEQRGFHY